MFESIYLLSLLQIFALTWVTLLFISPAKIRWGFLWYLQILLTEWLLLSILAGLLLPYLHPSLLWFPLVIIFHIMSRGYQLRIHNYSQEDTAKLQETARSTPFSFLGNIFPFNLPKTSEKIQEPEQNLEHLYFRCQNPQRLCIHIHGGAWKHGDSTQLSAIANLFSEQNIEMISINYEKYPTALLPEIVAKVEKTFLNLKQIYSPNKKVIVYGRSAGGHLALQLSHLHPNAIEKVIALYPVTDLPSLTQEPENDLLKSPTWIKEVTGQSYNSHSELYRHLSPSFNQKESDPPILVAHGANDPVVSIKQSNELFKMAKLHNRKIIYLALDKGTHGFDALWRGISMTQFKKLLITYLNL